MTWAEIVKHGYDQFVRHHEDLEYVVRCKDCIHGIPESYDTVTMKSSDELYCYRHHMGHYEDYYCADGKRKETEDE